MIRWTGLILLVLLMSACSMHRGKTVKAGAGSEPAQSAGVQDNIQLDQSRRYKQKEDGGPKGAIPDISALPQPVPRVEPRSRYGNKSPYRVNGHTYHVLKSAGNYKRLGIASWYGSKFQGHFTSSMEPYDMFKFTAASRVLPLPSYARVTNISNGKSVIVRVNDRGPFVSDRIIDLSYAAAKRLGMVSTGTAHVKVVGIDPSVKDEDTHDDELATAAPVEKSANKHDIWLQVGSFLHPANADKVASQLRKAELAAVHVTKKKVRGKQFTRVYLGPVDSMTKAGKISTRVQQLGLPVPQMTMD